MTSTTTSPLAASTITLASTTTPARTTALASSAAPLRITRRGRVLLLMSLVAVLFGSFSLGRANSEAAPEAGPAIAAASFDETVVQAGESLWTVARRIAPDNDPRQVVAQIRALNKMEGSQIQVGQLLLLPVAA